MKRCPNNDKIYKNDSVDYRSAKEVFEDFANEKIAIGLSDKTLTTYRNHINFFIKSMFGDDCDIRDITTKTYNDFIKYMKTREVSDATIQSYANSLRSFFNWCSECGEILYNVNIPLRKTQTKIKPVYTDEELTVLFKKPCLKDCTFTEYKVWVLENLLSCTGLRISSALGIRVSDVRFDDCSIIINTTKNKKAFITYFNDDMKKILIEYLKYRKPDDTSDFLFCRDDGKQLARRTAQELIADYNKKRNVNKTSAHLFRHTFARNSILSGLDVFTLMNMLQHSNIETTYKYLRTLGLDVKARVNIYNPQQKFSSGSNFKRKMR